MRQRCLQGLNARDGANAHKRFSPLDNNAIIPNRMEFAVSIALNILLAAVTTYLTIRLVRRKKPVWAYLTTKVIGLGTDAPPELKLTFDDKSVNDVYRTLVIFFNEGNTTIRRQDVSEKVRIHFDKAEILREPTLVAISKKAIKFSAKHVVKDGHSSVELDFLYLYHNDGAVFEILHTASEKPAATGDIMESESVTEIDRFVRTRPRSLRLSTAMLVGIMAILGSAFSLWSFFQGKPPSVEVFEQGKAVTVIDISGVYLIIALVYVLVFLAIGVGEILRYRKIARFPRWSQVQ